MRTRPDADYKWIAHAKDHFTRYSWACPLTNKEAPTILQSDNGKEFVASIIKEILRFGHQQK